MATGITIDEVTNTLDDIQGTEKIPVSSGISEPEVVTTGDLKDYINGGMQEEISDLDTIRSGASAGATAYQKPSSGIPSTDLTSDVQTSLGKADTALQSFTESDPTVPSWAKASDKPSYSASEVGAVPTTRKVNNKALSADVTLSASDVGALPSDTPLFSGSYDDLTDKPTIPAEQIQSDWNQSNTSAKDYIKNKPTIPDTSNCIQKSNTAGLVKNDGTIDTNTYLTQHQDISNYVQKSSTSGLLKNDGTVDTSTYLTSAPVTSVNGQTGAVSLALGDANVIETVKVNGSALTPDANKAVDITVPSVSGKEDTTNKVTSLSSSSTDTQYPSAKCVYDLIGDIETLLAAI